MHKLACLVARATERSHKRIAKAQLTTGVLSSIAQVLNRQRILTICLQDVLEWNLATRSSSPGRLIWRLVMVLRDGTEMTQKNRPGMTMKDPEPNKNLNVLIVGGFLGKKHGISRVVSDLSWGFGDRATIVTSVDPERFAYSVCDKTRIWRTEVRSRDIPYLRISDFDLVSRLRTAWSNMRGPGVHVVVSHQISAALESAFMKISILNRRVRISAFVYDAEEIQSKSWPGKIPQTIRIILFGMLTRIGVIDDVLVLSNGMAERASRIVGHLKVRVVRLGVSQSILSLAQKGNLKKPDRFVETRDFVVFFQGVPIPRRRIEDLVLAFGMLGEKHGQKACLYIGGALDVDHEYVGLIRKLIEQSRMTSRVHLLGDLSEEELAFMYNRCDLFVFPCDNQTWGLAPLEAMAFGKPTIVSTGSGVSEVLDPSVSVLVPPRNPKMIRDAIVELMEDDKRRKQLGMKARDYVTRKLTFADTVQDLKDFWNLKS